jgi:Secretion system C-terminal sorting domain
MLKRSVTFILLLMIPVLVSAQHLKRPLSHKTPVVINDPTGVFKANPNPGKTLADGNYIAVDTMTNGLGPSIATLNPVSFDPYSGTATWVHRAWNGHYGATSSGQLFYDISTDFGVTWKRVPGGVNTTNSQLSGRYPSMGISNSAKGPIAGTIAFFSWPELIAGAFGGVGYAADQPAGGDAPAAFIDEGVPNLYSSQTTCWASDITSDMFWAADYGTGAAVDLWTTPDFGTITKTSPPQWSDSVFTSGGVIAMGGQAWHGVQYYAVLGTFNENYAPNPINFGWYPGVSRSTDNGATWSDFKVCDFREIPKLSNYDELFSFTGSSFRVEGDMHVDKNGRAHLIVELADTTVDAYTYSKVALVDLFETDGGGWDATIITTAIDPSPTNIWMNATNMGVGQMGPSPYIAFDSTRNIMAVQFNNKGASGYADIFLTHKLLNDTSWSTPVNLTNSDSTDNIQTHLAPFLRTVTSGTNVECTAFSYYGYEVGVTGPLGNGNNETAGYMGAEKFTVSVTGVNDHVNTVNSFALSQNYPNPFNPSTKINYTLSEKSNVSLKVYDMLGREVANLINATQEAGNHSVNFNASKLASGMYVYTLRSGNNVMSKKLMLLK